MVRLPKAPIPGEDNGMSNTRGLLSWAWGRGPGSLPAQPEQVLEGQAALLMLLQVCCTLSLAHSRFTHLSPSRCHRRLTGKGCERGGGWIGTTNTTPSLGLPGAGDTT